MGSRTNFLKLMMESDEQFLRDLGERIRELRKARGLTQNELAERMGVTQALIASYESARRSVPLRKLCMLTDVFGVSMEELVGRSVPRRRKSGPPSRMERRLSEIEKLPRSEKQFVMRMLDNALAHAR